MRKKSKTLSVKTLQDRFNAYVVKRDGKCAVCGSTRLLQCSHIRSIGSFPFLRFDPKNGLAMCQHHHLYWWHKEILEASKWFEQNYPELNEYLESAIRDKYENPFKFKTTRLEQAEHIKRLEESLNNSDSYENVREM